MGMNDAMAPDYGKYNPGTQYLIRRISEFCIEYSDPEFAKAAPLGLDRTWQLACNLGQSLL